MAISLSAQSPVKWNELFFVWTFFSVEKIKLEITDENSYNDWFALKCKIMFLICDHVLHTVRHRLKNIGLFGRQEAAGHLWITVIKVRHWMYVVAFISCFALLCVYSGNWCLITFILSDLYDTAGKPISLENSCITVYTCLFIKRTCAH